MTIINPFRLLKVYLVRRIRDFIRAEVRNGVQEALPLIPQFLEFHNSPPQERQSFYKLKRDVSDNLESLSAIKSRLTAEGVPVEDVVVDVSDFQGWLHGFPRLVDSYRVWGDVFIEKCLEHYLAFKYLQLKPGDVYIDIAGAGSSFADVLVERGVNAFSLDLSYPSGIRGRHIGADAGDTKLPKEFANSLSAQCAFECFMGDADVRFVKEAGRILKPGGSYVIAPLYVDEKYYVATSPFCDQSAIQIDNGAKRVWRDDGYKVPFSRHYSPEAFVDRVYRKIPSGMCGRMLYVANLKQLADMYPEQRIYCAFLFHCKKAA